MEKMENFGPYKPGSLNETVLEFVLFRKEAACRMKFATDRHKHTYLHWSAPGCRCFYCTRVAK